MKIIIFPVCKSRKYSKKKYLFSFFILQSFLTDLALSCFFLLITGLYFRFKHICRTRMNIRKSILQKYFDTVPLNLKEKIEVKIIDLSWWGKSGGYSMLLVKIIRIMPKNNVK